MPNNLLKQKVAAGDSLSIRVGGWFEAHATGKGVAFLAFAAIAIAVCAVIGGDHWR